MICAKCFVYNETMISCLVLSAGESRRFGSPKALALIKRKPALEHIQNTLLTAPVDEVIIVTGANADKIKPHIFNHNKVRPVYNNDYKLGQTSSVQAGIKAVSKQCTAVLILPVDCPMILPSTITAIINIFNTTKPAILIPAYKSRRGHPPLFNAALIPDIIALSHDDGINILFEQNPPNVIEINDPGILKSFNTMEEYQRLFKD